MPATSWEGAIFEARAASQQGTALAVQSVVGLPDATSDPLSRLILQENRLPKVSIMIPTYNQAALISRAVESALLQDYPNLEIVVSDDCSTDGTRSVVEGYLADGRLTYHKNTSNLGRIGNYRKTLYERVTGEWALNLDGDDYLFAGGVVSRMISAILEHPSQNVVAAMGPTKTVNAVMGLTYITPEDRTPGLFEGTDIFLRWNKRSFHHLAVLYKAALARELDYYRLNTIMSDCESVLRLVLHGNVAVVDDIVGVWNIHGNNTSSVEDITQALEDYSYIEESYKYAQERKVEPQNLSEWYRAMIRFHTRWILRSSIPVATKARVFLPYLFESYPFALTEAFNVKSLAVILARMHPASYRNARRLYAKLTGSGASLK